MGKSTFTGPVAGAYHEITCTVGAGVATKEGTGLIPTGMIFRWYAISVFQRTGGSCAIIAGNAGDTDGYAKTLNFSPDIAGYKLLDGDLCDPTGIADLTGGDELLFNFGGTLTDPTQITMHGYIVGHPDDLDREGE